MYNVENALSDNGQVENPKNNDVTKLIQRFHQQVAFNIKITADKSYHTLLLAETSQ
jgi:hypothetical protein